MYSIIKHEGKFACMCQQNESRAPIKRTWIWPLVNVTIEGMGGADPETAIGKEARWTAGTVSCYLGHGIYFRAAMPQLGSTPAIYMSEEPIPMPKTRGMETRYNEGRWEKFSKAARKWVAA